MPKFRIPEIVLGSLLTIAVFAIGSAVHLVNLKVESIQQSQPTQNLDPFAPWAEVATVFLALTTILTAWIAHRTRKDASESAQRQLRAYMGVAVVNEIDIDDTADYVDVRLLFHNYGSTPAYRVHYRGELQIVGAAANMDRLTIDVDTMIEYAPRVIQPGAEFGYLARLPIDRAGRQSVKIGRESRIILWGALVYWDAFKTKRHNKFRFYFGGDECVRAKRMFWDDGPDANDAD